MREMYKPGGRVYFRIVEHNPGYSVEICEIVTNGEEHPIARTEVFETQEEAMNKAIKMMKEGYEDEQGL